MIHSAIIALLPNDHIHELRAERDMLSKKFGSPSHSSLEENLFCHTTFSTLLLASSNALFQQIQLDFNFYCHDTKTTLLD